MRLYMDPKQTSPLGNTPAGGQEGQNGQPAGTQPVFETAGGNNAAGNSTAMAGQLGAANLSTGANVSRTMDSLNSKNQSATGSSVFSKHKFDKVDPNGDIILPTSGPVKKERKPINKGVLIKIAVIAGGILGVLVIVLAVVLMPKGGGNKQGGGTIASNLDYQQAFNRYANYVLFGVDSDSQIPETEFNDYEIYQLEYSIKRTEITPAEEAEYTAATVPITANSPKYQLIDKNTFFDTAMEYYADFLSKTGDIDNELYPSAQTLIPTQTNGINFLNVYSRLKQPAVKDILAKVVDEGIDATNEYIDAAYFELSESSESGRRYADIMKKYLKALANEYDYLNNNQCIKNNSVDRTCASKLSNIPEIAEDSTYETMSIVTNVLYDMAISNVLRGCFYITNQFNNPKPITMEIQEVFEGNTESTESAADETNAGDEGKEEGNRNGDKADTSSDSTNDDDNENTNTQKTQTDQTADGGNSQ